MNSNLATNLVGLILGFSIAILALPRTQALQHQHIEPNEPQIRSPAVADHPTIKVLPSSTHSVSLASCDQPRLDLALLQSEYTRLNSEFEQRTYRTIEWNEVGQSAEAQEQSVRASLATHFEGYQLNIETMSCEEYPCIAKISWEGPRSPLDSFVLNSHEEMETRQSSQESEGITTATIAFLSSEFSPDRLESSVVVRMGKLMETGPE